MESFVLGSGRRATRLVWAMIVAALGALGTPAAAQMPEPYVSPTLDAVLMPVTKQVVAQFKLPKKASGAVVVSVEPGGVADLYGVEPGEVITSFGTKKFRRPADLDAMVLKSLRDGNAYFYFQGLRKGRDKRTIIYLEEQDYRKPVAVRNIPRWRSFNAPTFNFARWYDPYSYYIVDIWDYSIYYVDQVIVSDVFITNYYSETNYLYYDYTEISTLEVRDSWAVEEASIYCGDVEGYSCGVTEVGYPVEEVFETCSGAPGDDWCLPPDAVDATYCSSFPSDPSCAAAFVADDYCAYNPEDPSCGGAVAGDAMSTEGEDWTAYCAQNPDAQDCGGMSSAEAMGEPDYTAAEEGATEGQVYDEPAYDEPAYDEPAYDEPAYDEQAYEDPAYEDPTYDAQAYEEQAYEEPAYEDPAYEEQPLYEEPAYEEPVYEDPAYEEQAYEEPVYEEPAYEEPVYEEPAYEEPVYEEPAYDGGGGEGECYYDEEGNYICGSQ